MASDDDKKFWVDSAIKVGLVVWGVQALSDFLTFGQPGLTDRLPYDYAKTQTRRQYYTRPDGSEVYMEVNDPWKPNDLARRLHTAMNGPQIDLSSTTPRSIAWDEITRLGYDRARWLHNYWLDQVDHADTLYRWIDSQQANGGAELVSKANAMRLLQRWGAGF